MKTLQSLFLDELADIYDAEARLTKALPKFAKAATHEELREAFDNHQSETEAQTDRLNDIFKAFGQSPRAKKCEAIEGLIKEADSIISENKGQPTINAALICAAQKIEHYEIATYGTLREWAEQLENREAAELLDEILEEEKGADEKLTDLARECCNESAEGAEDSEEAHAKHH